MATLVDKLTEMLNPAVEASGFELWGVEFVRAGKHSTLRLFIDHENGIDVDDCALVSRQVSAVLDVEDPISAEYNLEVSSPGMDRPLFSLAHYEMFIGEKVSVQTNIPVDNRRKFTGKLVSVDGDQIQIEIDNDKFNLSFAQIKKANLIPVLD